MATTKVTTKDVDKAINAIKALNINPVLQTQIVGALSKYKTQREIGFTCNPCGKIEAWS